MSTIVLHLSSTEGLTRLRLGHADARPYEAILAPGALEAAAEEIGALLRPAPGLAVRGRDGAVSRREEEAGRILGRLLDAGARERLLYHLGEARGRGALACIAVDCPDAAARSLPWELLALDRAPLEALGEAVVVRLVEGPRPSAPSPGPLQIEVWTPDPGDPLCGARQEALARVAATRGVQTSRAGSEARPGRTLLHVICHGASDAQETRLLLGDRERAAGSEGHLLSPHLTRAELVVLEVCEAGVGHVAELESLAGRLVATGARATVAARGRLAEEAAAALDDGLLEALVAGRPLIEALAAARRAVRALASPRPDARWHLPSLFVSSLEVLRAPAAAPPVALPGWPAAAPDAAAWLMEATRLAEDADRGFLGGEHLLLALPSGRGALALARHALEARRGALLASLGGLQRRGQGVGLKLTPALARLSASLEPGFDADALWAAMVRDPALVASLDLSSARGAVSFLGQTLDAGASVFTGPPEALEIVGGPEGGRVLHLAPGAWIGRAEDESPDGLYPRPGPVDPYLSRRHLRWLGEGRVELARPGRLERPGEGERVVTGEVQLHLSDLLHLSPITRLLARAR